MTNTTIRVTVPAEVKEALDRWAVDEYETTSALVRRLILRSLRNAKRLPAASSNEEDR